jgi:hypothetical protein
MMRNARLSTTIFDTHSPLFTAPTPTSKLSLVISSIARNVSLFLKEDKTCVLPSLTPPKHSWHTILPHHSPLPSDLKPGSLFSYMSTLYDIPRQAQIQVTSPPSSCFLFLDNDNNEIIWVMSNSKATKKEGFQANFFKHDLYALVSHLVDLFNHVVCTSFSTA